MAVMASDGPSPNSSSLRFGLTAPQPSRRHHVQSLLGPSFHDPRTPHVLESHPERAAPLSRRDDSVSDDMLSALTPPLHCASILQPATLPQVVAFESGQSLLQFVSIISLLLNHGNPIFEPVCVFLPFPLLPLLL